MVFARLPRLVHDIGAKLGKLVEIETTGETTELDKTVLEKLGDPLVHIVRNSVDHGIELPAERVAAGKPPHGTIHIRAEHRGSAIIIEVAGDGRGLDYPKIRRSPSSAA
jgi:two-component system chemotaxis sensor kinase CheA